jgi:NAD(P)-dependent dehydrogenase (short-subunit alcohol dehydrogenase family)
VGKQGRAVAAVTIALAEEVAKDGILVNAVAPIGDRLQGAPVAAAH